MHEASLAMSLIETMTRVAREHGAGRIVAADLEIGALTSVEPDSLMFAFEVLSRGTEAEACALRFRRVPLVVRCPSCDFEGETAEPLGCPECGAVGLTVVTGREFRLVSIDTEDAPEHGAREAESCT